jgi:outer membrane protein assembly factor BamB
VQGQLRALVALAALFVPLPHPGAAAAAFAPAARGCPMAHCQPSMADQVELRPPRAIASSWLDASAASGAQGLGCAGNGTIAACTFGDRSGGRSRPYLKTYDARGKMLWDSGRALSSWAWTSAAMIDERGGVIAADDRSLVRFAPGGRRLWSARTPGGAPISPTRVANGTIVLATNGGPVSAFDPDTGRRIGVLDLRATLDGVAGRFDTTNTPGARGNRVYVSTELTLDGGRPDPNHHARLYAIDVDPSKPAGKRLHVAWTFAFGARSGASPLVVGDTVVFDGDRETPSSPAAPRFFGVRDAGKRPHLLWQYPLGGPGEASAAQDPRGGAWVFAFGNPTLRRISTKTGAVLQTIDVDGPVGDVHTHVPYSAMSISRGPGGHPTMVVSARASFFSVWLLCLDLATGRTLWRYEVPGEAQANTPEGQFPILTGAGGRSTVVFSMRGGIRGVVGP